MAEFESPPTVQVQPGGPVKGTVVPPGSKSLTNRALICAAFAKGISTLRGCLVSEDTEVMIESLRRCGVDIDIADAGKSLKIRGIGAEKATAAESREDPTQLYIANSGTSVRFLTAALSALGGHYQLSGVERMHARPIADLVHAIQPIQSGRISAESENGCPPVLIHSKGWKGSKLSVAGNVSSQYLSGLMMAAPIALASSGIASSIEIVVHGELVSKPYVDMTANVISSFGPEVNLVDVANEDTTLRVVISNSYSGSDYRVEPDASAASYFWAAAAISGGEVKVRGLNFDALQGDVGFCRVLEQMGCKVSEDSSGITVSGRAATGVDVDMNPISDTVQTLAVVALFADGPTRVRGVAHNRFKETDRIGDLATELRRMGASVVEHEDGLTIEPPHDGLTPCRLKTYHDHRMAMSLSLAGLASEGITIEDPACTAKTYPRFFFDLETLLGRTHRWG
ncbi:MAG: 3-phosphoshikimate 1-carboxyvinyltransferase [Planctomycetota bacterium]